MAAAADQQDEKVLDQPARGPACSLFVILARKAPVGVILRRGPTRWVQLILWHTDTDTSEPGQWLHGRIYERQADLSPGGRLLVYFAAKPGRLGDQQGYCGWTAVSRPPFLTALASWPQGVCFLGGGLFRTARILWLNHAPDADLPAGGCWRGGLQVLPKRDAIGWLYLTRLQRDGWVLRQQTAALPGTDDGGVRPAILERRHPTSPVTLVLTVTPYGVDTFGVREASGGAIAPIEGAAWADWDHRGRLVFARHGMLFAGAPGQQPVPIADFREAKPEPIVAPEWAKVW